MLPAETERVWAFLREHPALAGFVLIGGTALTLRLDHRVSEDLDFVWTGAVLPNARIDALLEDARAAGFVFEPDDDEAAVIEFETAGMELHDHQRDFAVDGAVKVTFFTAPMSLGKVLDDGREQTVRVASLPELFRSKALVSASRSKSRDVFDLYWLMTHTGFTIEDYHQAFVLGDATVQCDIGLGRLCAEKAPGFDEGLSKLVADPPSVEEMRMFFVRERDRLEVMMASLKTDVDNDR